MSIEVWLPSLVSIAFALTALYVAVARRHKPTWKAGLVILLACAEINAARVFQDLSSDLTQKTFWFQMIYFGFTIVPTAFLVLSLSIIDRNRLLNRKLLLLLCVFPLVSNILTFTNEYHGLVWNPAKTLPIVNSLGFPPVADGRIFHWLLVVYSALVLSIGVYFLLNFLVRSKGVYNLEFTAVILAGVLGLLGVLIDVFHLTNFKPYTTTTLGLAVCSITTALILSNLRRRDVLSFSRGTIFNNISDAIIVVDEESLIVDVNRTTEELAGKSKTQIIGLSLKKIFPELVVDFSNYTPQKNVLAMERNNHKFVFDLRVSTIQDWMGKNKSQVFVLRDITERKRAEEDMRYFTEGTHAIFWRASVTKIIDEKNGEADYYWDTHYANLDTVMKFIPLQEYPSQKFSDRFYFSEVEEDRLTMKQRSSEAIRGGLEGYSQEFRILDANGVIHWMFEDARIQRLSETQSEVVGFITEITDRKRSEEEIHRLNAELEQRVQIRTAELSDLYNNAPCGYQSLDIDGYFARINDTQLNWLGYTREELIGKIKFSDLLTPESLIVFKKIFPILLESGSISDMEYGIKRKNGSILPVLVSESIVKDIDGKILMTRSTMIDNTNRKRIEKEMRESQTRLEEANKDLKIANNELEAFSYSVSHDLRQPLRSIDGFSNIIEQEYSEKIDPEGIQLFEKIRKNTKKMDRLITDLLGLSSISRKELIFSNMVMSNLARTIYEDLAPTDDSKKFEFYMSPVPDAYGDPILIQQVWSNLISNAIKYTAPKIDRKIEIGSYRKNEMNVYFVRDNGVGFDEAYTHKLFGVFQRLHSVSEFEGTGVGLAIVQRIIFRHGGTVWAEGKINQGATFYFSLPIVRDPE